MNLNIKLAAGLLFASMATVAFAKPLPKVIIQDEKAVVPVTKIQVVRTAEGQKPVRMTETTILEMKNKGQDIVSRNVEQVEETADFAPEKLAIPSLHEKAVIVPISKIEQSLTETQDGQVIRELKEVNAVGVEFKEGQEPVRKDLKIGTAASAEGKISRAVVSNDGKASKDITIVRPAE